MALANIYQLTDVQRAPNGELVENVYFYNNSGLDGSAEGCAAAFVATLLPGIFALQSDQFDHTLISVKSLGDFSDFAELALAGVDGAVAADCLPAFNALNFTLRSTTRSIRPGSKRYGGMPDLQAYYNNGVIVDEGQLSRIETLRNNLTGAISDGAVDYFHVLVKRIPVPATEDHKAYYRLPESDGELVTADVVTVLVNTTLSHQTSRGNGR